MALGKGTPKDKVPPAPMHAVPLPMRVQKTLCVMVRHMDPDSTKQDSWQDSCIISNNADGTNLVGIWCFYII